MARIIILMVLTVAVLFSQAGCSVFEEPSQLECEAAIDNFIELSAREHAGSDHPIIGGLVQRGTKIFTKMSGDYGDAVKKCMTTMSRHAAVCAARSSSTKHLEECW